MENPDSVKKDVAIIGIGFRIPSGNNDKSISEPNEFYNKLLNGFNGIIETHERWSNNFNKNGVISNKYSGLLPLSEIKSFDPMFFGINPSEVSTIDPQQRLLLNCTWEALEDAGIDPISIRGTNIPVFIGSSTFDYYNINKPIFANDTFINVFGSTTHSCANRISYCFDLHGESVTNDTACSSSLNAINMGYKSIINGDTNLSICGGCNLIFDPNITKAFTYLNMLSPTGSCKSFSSDADGYVRSEGIGIVILKSLDQAIRDGNNIYCVIKGSNSNSDGNYDKSNFYSPSKISQFENIKTAIKSTNGSVDESDIDYFECHGTGTPTGDPIELEGISMVFKNSNKKDPLLIGSIKSNIGHSEASSGVSALIKCCVMFKYQTFLPNINFKSPNPAIKFDEWNLKVVTEPIKFNKNKLATMIINNFGVTGSNVCIVLKEYISNNGQLKEPSDIKKQYLIPFSSNSSTSLNSYKTIINKLSESSLIPFNQYVCKQIYNKSPSLVQRSVIIASDWNELKNDKNEIKSTQSKISNMTVGNKKAPTVFVLCGQGSQYNKMALSLYENEPYYKQWIDKFDQEFSKHYGYSILQKLRSIPDGDLISINEPMLVQPANIMTQVSLFELYKYWGVSPDIIVGHSLGEVSSAYCSGMIDFQTLCCLIYHRSVAQNKTTGAGRMLSINISPEEYRPYSSKYPLLEVACFNSPTSIVVVGKESTLNELSKELKSKDVFCAMLGAPSSLHSSSQLILKDDILKLVIKSQQPTTPVFSTVTTNLFDSSTPFNSQYVFDNIHKPVYFSQTISNIYKYIESNDLGNEFVFIEVSPHPTLQYYLNQMKSQQSEYFGKGDKITIYSACNKKKNDYQEFLKTISMLYVHHSFNINFKSQIKNNNILSTFDLPLYQWDNSIYWREEAFYEKIKKHGPSIQHLGNSVDSPAITYQSTIDIKKQTFNWLKGHSIKGKYYFPGCGYIDNLLKCYPNQDLTIGNMDFKTPFILQEGINQSLQTTINPIAKNEYSFKFHFKDTKTNQWTLASLGNFNLFNHGNQINKVNVEQIKTRCNYTKVSKDDLYDKIKIKTGLQYKGLFKGLKECFYGNNCSLSILSLNEIANQKEYNHLKENEHMNTFFNTAILDTCFHGMNIIHDYNCNVVFDRIEGFKYYASNVPTSNKEYQHSEIYVYSEMKPLSNPFSYSGSLKVFLSDGTLLIEFKNAVSSSITPITDYSTIIAPPSNQLFTPCLQEKNSYQKTKQLSSSELDEKDYNVIVKIEQLLLLFYQNINKRCPEINLQTLSTMDYNQFKKLYFRNNGNENLFIYVYECLIKYYELNKSQELKDINQNEFLHERFYQLFNKSTRILAKQIFPLENDDPNLDTPQSLFENGLLDYYYNNEPFMTPKNGLLGETVLESIKNNINEPIVFRILEFGGGLGSLSIVILEKIHKLLQENPSYQIDIEYTWSDISSSFFSQIKNKLSNIVGINVIYKVFDLDQSLRNQDLNQSYYDIVVMSDVLHAVKDLKSSLNQIQNVIKPNGQLLFIEPPYKSIHLDAVFGCFSQWWSFEDKDLRIDRCCMKPDNWLSLLKECNYRDSQISGNANVLLIQSRTRSIDEIINEKKDNEYLQLVAYDYIVLYGGSDDYISTLFKSNLSLKSKLLFINNIDQFEQFISSYNKEKQTLVVFLKALTSVDINNFKEISLEYIQIYQKILKLGLSKQFVNLLLTYNSTKENFLSSSLVGVCRYFNNENQELNIFSIDFDKISLYNENLLKLIDYLIDSNTLKEYIIKNNIVFNERFKKNTNIKHSFVSKTFETNKDQLMVQLDSNLEYTLKPKRKQLKPNEIEIETKGTGINYKDYLIYTGIVGDGKEMDLDSLNIGSDVSGIISRCGCDVKKFKIGDQVFGVGSKSNGSHTIADYKNVYYKPSNISHVEAASIPSVYLTSLHSIFYVGNLKKNETILIHSATGGVGLSALELLKYKEHQGCIFVTVGSEEKENYLKNKYGSFITDIYSSRNKNYVTQIKDKLISLGCGEEHQGVDLILNTLSSEYMDSNFECLNPCGRITDLSITHLTPNDYMDYNKFKFNQGYHNIELSVFPSKTNRFYLKKLYRLFESKKLKLIPIIEYSNTQIRDSIQYINERKHIGKIVVNHDTDMISKIFEEFQSTNSILMKQKYDISNLNFGKNILVSGQTGIILEILKWLVKHSNQSIENIIVLSKSKLKWELEFFINQIKDQSNNNIKFHFNQIDIENNNEINRVLSELETKSNISDINSIIHFAFVNDICNIQDIDMNSLNKVHGPKTIGAINLHNESINRKWDIKQFILASSIASVFGSTKQCSYVSANVVIDSLSKYRKSIGLPSLTLNIGAVSSTGFVSRNESIEEMFNSEFYKLISPQIIISSIDLFSQNIDNYSNYIIADFNFETIPTKNFNNLLYKLDYQMNKEKNNLKLTNGVNVKNKENLSATIISKISELLSIEESKLNLDFRLIDYGLDSLVIVQLKNWVDKEFGYNLTTIQKLQNNKISASIQNIIKESNQKSIDLSLNKQKKQSIDEFIEQEIKLDDSIKSKPYSIETILNNPKKSIFLTGSTGLLGVYLLFDLIQLEHISKVYCLLRNKTNQSNPLNEILNHLKNHKLYQKLKENHLSKIRAVVGNIANDNLGLSSQDYQLISNECDIIINSAADLNLQTNYDSNKTSNVESVKKIIQLSVSNEKYQKPIIHFSSFSVFINQSLNNKEFDETKISPRFENTQVGYIQSKYIGERMLINAAENRGIPSLIMRLPCIWSNSETGIGNPQDFLQNTLQVSLSIGFYPNNYKTLYCTPVNTLSKNIINVLLNQKSWFLNNNLKYSIFNLNGNPFNSKFFYKILNKYYGCKELEPREWNKLVSKSDNKLCKIYTLFNNNFIDILKNISVEECYQMSNRTKEFLKSINSYNENDWDINEEMFIKMINYNCYNK